MEWLARWFSPWRRRLAIQAAADRLEAQHGAGAFNAATAWERSFAPNDTSEAARFAFAVRREVARRVGYRTGLDNATRRELANAEGR